MCLNKVISLSFIVIILPVCSITCLNRCYVRWSRDRYRIGPPPPPPSKGIFNFCFLSVYILNTPLKFKL